MNQKYEWLMQKVFSSTVRLEVRQELLVLLKECLKFLSDSEDSVWSEMDVSELSQKISKAIEKLEQGKLPDKAYLNYLFAPTAPLQETAMTNGWSDQYMALSSKFDTVIKKWN